MRRGRIWTASAGLLALGCQSAGHQEPTASVEMLEDSDYQRTATPGVLCVWSIQIALAEIGKRCFPGQDAAFQSELNSSIRRIDEYILRNSEFTPAHIANFKREQGLSQAPDALLCEGDMVHLYRSLTASNLEELRAGTDQLLSRPGQVEWGDCL